MPSKSLMTALVFFVVTLACLGGLLWWRLKRSFDNVNTIEHFEFTRPFDIPNTDLICKCPFQTNRSIDESAKECLGCADPYAVLLHKPLPGCFKPDHKPARNIRSPVSKCPTNQVLTGNYCHDRCQDPIVNEESDVFANIVMCKNGVAPAHNINTLVKCPGQEYVTDGKNRYCADKCPQGYSLTIQDGEISCLGYINRQEPTRAAMTCFVPE